MIASLLFLDFYNLYLLLINTNVILTVWVFKKNKNIKQDSK